MKSKTLKILVPLILLVTFMFPNFSLASVTSVQYVASGDYYNIHFSSTNVSKFTFHNLRTGKIRSFDYAGVDQMTNFKCNAPFEMKFYNSSGNLLSTYNGETTQVKNESETCSSSDGGDNNGGSQDCGCIFNTPGWGDYMGKIDEIIGAIPPPPNWGKVADTFRDSIVPKLIGDLSGLLGSAPSLPRAPSMPGGLDDGNLKKPTGKEDPGLKGFTGDDIKNEAPKIEEREDPTGGWDILDPIGQLPSQDEFKDNIPNEGEMIAPEVPDVEGKAPHPPEEENKAPGSPKEDENIAPKPPEQENVAPGAPDQGENPTPGAPKDDENIAPKPPEQSNPAPGAPNQGENPIPGAPKEDENIAPVPGGNSGSFPIPGDGIGKPPLPNEGGTAPIPGEGGGQAPIPNNDGNKAPIPR